MKLTYSLLAASLLFAGQSAADGLADLKATLASLKATTPVTANLTYAIHDRNGEDDEQEIDEGQVTVQLQDSLSGMQVLYQLSVLAAVDKEAQLRIQDEKAQTPTITALDRIDTRELHNMLSAAEVLERRLQEVEFSHEEAVEFEGQSLRKLYFNMPLESLIKDQRTRKYVKKFSSDYYILIDEQGVPLEAKMTFEGKGRAYIVLRVEASGSSHHKYAVVGDRLVTLSSEIRNGYDTTFGEGENIETRRLDLVQNPDSRLAMVAH